MKRRGFVGRWLDRQARRFGYVPERSIPIVGTRMFPVVQGVNSVEILGVDLDSVRYRNVDGNVRTRCRWGFMKNYERDTQ